MFPWLWFWAPQFHYPLSGDVEQDIEAFTKRWFNAIPASAGNGRKEREIVRSVSYGKQLGAITKLLLALTEKVENQIPEGSSPEKQNETIAGLTKDLKTLHDKINRAKNEITGYPEDLLLEELQRLKAENEARFVNLSKKMLPLLQV